MAQACDFDPMNSLNGWCRRFFPVCCLVIGIEGMAFEHHAAIQTRLIESPSIARMDKSPSDPKSGKHCFDFFSPKLAIN